MKLQFSTKYVKDFAEFTFNRIISLKGWNVIEELLIQGIGNNERSIKLPKYNVRLSNIFYISDKIVADEKLKKGGSQLRYNNYTTFEKENLYCYFSNQWGFNSKVLNLDLVNLSRLINNHFKDDFKITLDKKNRLYIFEEFLNDRNHNIPTNISTKPNTIFYGAPGTGKSYKIENEILKGIPEDQKERITFHPDYDNASFVGGYMPVSEIDANGEENIKYKFVPQVFTNIYVKAWQNPDKPYFLVIEEINRGNCAEIFGDIFQLLDRKSNYSITPKAALQKHLIKKLGKGHQGIKNSKMSLPQNLQLLATMNTSDQSLFPMDSAFKRRWDWEYIPINYDKSANNPSANFYVSLDEKHQFSWLDFIKEMNIIIKGNAHLGEDKCIGNYFITPDDDEISLKEFINKALFYLWIDVFSEEEETPFEDGKSYSDFFPIDSNGKTLVEEMLKKLKIPIKLKIENSTDENID